MLIAPERHIDQVHANTGAFSIIASTHARALIRIDHPITTFSLQI
jgi:hypothetical protein